MLLLIHVYICVRTLIINLKSCCINCTAQIQNHDYIYIFIFNVDAEMLQTIQNELNAAAIHQKAQTR